MSTAAPQPSPAGHADPSVALLFADLEGELASTRRLLERFPDEHADWRPHPKSMSLAQLAAHVAELPELGRAVAAEPGWDAVANPYVASGARTRADVLALFERSVAGLRAAMAALDASALGERWRMYAGDAEFVGGPRALILRQLGISHLAHHRGQLTVYYRMVGVPVPGMYGPTADDA